MLSPATSAAPRAPRRSAAGWPPWAPPPPPSRRAIGPGTARRLGARNPRDSSVQRPWRHLRRRPRRLFTWMAKPLRLWALWLLKVMSSVGGCRTKAAATAKPLWPCCPAWLCGSTGAFWTAGVEGAEGLSSPRSNRSRPPPFRGPFSNSSCTSRPRHGFKQPDRCRCAAETGHQMLENQL